MLSRVHTALVGEPVESGTEITPKDLHYQVDCVAPLPATEALPYVFVWYKGQARRLLVMAAETHGFLATNLDAKACRHIEDGDLLD